jgi:hypothetical protein
MLARLEPVLVGELGRDREGDGNGLVGEPLDVGDGQLVETGPMAGGSALGREVGHFRWP